MKNSPDVSIVIATRDRPSNLIRLLRCVKQQTLRDLECIVVDDGSTDETIYAYGRIWNELDDRFRLLLQPVHERQALGPSNARNRGIKVAQGEFIAFCDDDDLWVRDDHLAVAASALREQGADFFFGNLQTSRGGTILGPDFYGTVRHIFTRTPVRDGLFEVSRKDRIAGMKHMFLHCDSMVVSAELLHRTGLFWEKLAMAEDRDLGLRLLDRAAKVLYRDVVVADYDRSVQVGICKSYTEAETRQFIILAMLHAETAIEDRALRRVARGYRAWMFYELAQFANEAGRIRQSRELALQSLLLRPTAAAAGLLLRAAITSEKSIAVKWKNRAEER